MGKQNEDLNIIDDDEELDTQPGGGEGGEGEGGGEPEDRGDNLDPEGGEGDGGEPEGGEPEDGAGEGGGKSKFVPHGRFNEVNEELKREREARLRLEEELARARGTAAAVQKPEKEEHEPAFDFDAKEEEYANALMEGDTKKASAIRKEINAELRRQAEEEAATRAEQRLLARQAEQEFKAAVAEAYDQYPFLDAKDANANPQAIAEVVEWRDFYMNKGNSPAEALRKAVDKVGPQYAEPPKGGEGGDGGQQGKPNGTTRSNVAQIQEKLRQRQQQALQRNARAAGQPPATGMVGAGNRGKQTTDVDVEDLSEEEFEKLPEAEKKRLRGD